MYGVESVFGLCGVEELREIVIYGNFKDYGRILIYNPSRMPGCISIEKLLNRRILEEKLLIYI